MKRLEKTLLMLIVLSILAKLVPLPFNGIVITFAALALSILYFFFGFAVFPDIGFRQILKKESYSNLKPWDIIISVFTGMAFQILVIGLLFKIQYWPGASVMSRTALISNIPFLILASWLLMTQNRFVYVAILKRGVPLFLFLLFLHLLPLTTRLNIFKVDSQTEALILNDANSRQ